ncbi:MAG: GNAT family N-acetyltransferase [Flavobacteriales bacterium]|jgi:GNAT superfamily N-acetyltransferase|nr:MAG: GNAT family N-acetyltransferase [Flavobacteriales bacterium]
MTHLRTASIADIAAIRSIAHAAWPAAYAAILSPAQLAYMLDLMYSEAALEEQMTAKGHRFLMAERDGHAVGFAAFEHGHGAVRSTRLHKLYALPIVKGTGVGSALLAGVEAAALSAGDAQVELNVNRFNPTKAWYARKGFAVVRDEVIEIGEGFVMDDHVMVRALR